MNVLTLDFCVFKDLLRKKSEHNEDGLEKLHTMMMKKSGRRDNSEMGRDVKEKCFCFRVNFVI